VEEITNLVILVFYTSQQLLASRYRGVGVVLSIRV
jgi:hypothetical protein